MYTLCGVIAALLLHKVCVSIVMGIFTQQGGRPGAGGSGGGAGGMFGFGQTTAKIMKDDVGVRFK